MTSVYHTYTEGKQWENQERGKKKKHNNRHMISMLAFLRQDAPRYLLLKQLCVFEHTYAYYLFDAFQPCPSIVVYRLSASVGIFARRRRRRETGERG